MFPFAFSRRILLVCNEREVHHSGTERVSDTVEQHYPLYLLEKVGGDFVFQNSSLRRAIPRKTRLPLAQRFQWNYE